MSPFGFRSNRSWNTLLDTAIQFGDWIAIHTDPRWGGSFDLLKMARGQTKKPIIAKGIHINDNEIQKAIDNGADYVLVVGRLPIIHPNHCLIEPTNLKQLTYHSDTKVVWNSRNLSTGGTKAQDFDQARQLWPNWMCQASNISDISQVNPTANAFIVGEHMIKVAHQL